MANSVVSWNTVTKNNMYTVMPLNITSQKNLALSVPQIQHHKLHKVFSFIA